MTRWNPVFASVLALLSLCAAVGCGKKGPVMYQVQGKVSYTGGPAPQAGVNIVTFLPTKDSKAEVRRNATGPIGPDGSFVMSTRVSGDGVNAGEYGVTFDIAKGPMDPTMLVPQKYTDPNMPPYKVTVDHNIDDLDYKIDMSAGASGK